jgi:hypothetical protein
MAAAKMKDELEQLRHELTTLAEQSAEARQRRAEQRQATIARWQGIGDSVKRHARQITPLVLVGALVLGVLVGRRLIRK